MRDIRPVRKIPIINPRYISYSYLGVSVIICSVFLFFFVRPTLIEAGRLVKTIERGKELDKQLTQKLENLAKAETLINENKNLIPLIDIALPNTIDTPTFVDKITKIASENNIPIHNLSDISSGSKSFEANTISFTINVSGQYDSIFNLIKTLENNLQILSAENVSIVRNGDEYTSTLSVNAYGYTYDINKVPTIVVPFKGVQQ